MSRPCSDCDVILTAWQRLAGQQVRSCSRWDKPHAAGCGGASGYAACRPRILRRPSPAHQLRPQPARLGIGRPKAPSLPDKQRPPGGIVRPDRKALWRPELAGVEVPAIPAHARHLPARADAQQVHHHARRLGGSCAPVVHRAGRHLKKLRRLHDRQARIRQQRAQAQASTGAAFAGFGRAAELTLDSIRCILCQLTAAERRHRN